MDHPEYLFQPVGSQYNVSDLIVVLKSKGILSDVDIDYISGRLSMPEWLDHSEE